MKRTKNYLLTLTILAIFLTACNAATFSPPTEIHLNSSDQMGQAAVAVDADGRSHIAGVINDRIVYYRTRYGEKLIAFEMTMTGSGANWKQYNPDIAVLDSGYAFVTWVEQRGGPQKYACYQQIPSFVPIEGFDKDCDPLDDAQQTAGNVRVTASGTTAYAVYDRPAGNGRTADLWYQQLAGGSAIGRVDWFFSELKTVEIYSLDLGIDDGGYLHVGYHYSWTIGGTPPFTEHMELRSNRATQPDGQMSQVWLLSNWFLIHYTPVSLSFYYVGPTQRVALAFGSYVQVYVDSCTAAGCLSISHDEVYWPSDWWTNAMLNEVRILGIGENLHVAFTGNSNATPITTDQVYYSGDALGTVNPSQVSTGALSGKHGLSITRATARPENGFGIKAVLGWGETSQTANEIYVYDGTNTLKIYETSCTSSIPRTDMGSYGYYVSGVWDDCGGTRFSAEAKLQRLPLIVK